MSRAQHQTSAARRDDQRSTNRSRNRASQGGGTAGREDPQVRPDGRTASNGRGQGYDNQRTPGAAGRTAQDARTGQRTAQRTAPYSRQQYGDQDDYPPVSQLGASPNRSRHQPSRADGQTRQTVRATAARRSVQPSQAGSARRTAGARGSRAGTEPPPTAPTPEATPDLAGAIYIGDDEEDYDEYDDEYYEIDAADYRALTDEYCGPPRCNCFPSPSNGRLPSMMYDGIRCKHNSKYNMAGMNQKHARFFHDNWGPPIFSQEPENLTNPPYKKFADYERAHRMVKAAVYFRPPPPKTPEPEPEEEEYVDEDDEVGGVTGHEDRSESHGVPGTSRVLGVVATPTINPNDTLGTAQRTSDQNDEGLRNRQSAARTAAVDRRSLGATTAARPSVPRQTARQTAAPTRDKQPSRQVSRDVVAAKERELERKLNVHKNQPDTIRGKIYDPVTKKMIVYSVSHKNEEENFYPGQR